jgi:hypothetical protein
MTFESKSCTGPQGSRDLRLPEFLDTWHMKVTRFLDLITGRFTPKRYPWYWFLFHAESTPGS